MNCSIKLPLALLALLFSFSCSEKDIKSEDFTAESVFTNGIEGPAVDQEGYLYAVNFEKEGTIGRVDKNGKGEIYITLPEGSIGNGIRFDTNGNMFVADYKRHIVYRFGKDSREPMVWARDTTMSQPNDLALSDSGHIYLSDPKWADETGRLWMVTPEREIVLLEDHMGTTNGIEVSPDGKWLYVNESVQRNIWKYKIMDNGTLADKTKFMGFDDFGMDGMRCDVKGNLYITRYDKGTVLIVSPDGITLSEVSLTGKKPSNLTFGGDDGRTCYVTLADRGCVEQFRAPYPGK